MSITQELLHSRGLQADPDELDELIDEVVRTLPAGMYRSDATSELAPAEVDALRRGGLDLEPVELGSADPLSRTTAEYVALLRGSLSVRQAADALGVSTGRIRQMLTGDPPRLFGVRGRSAWRIPAFQFTEHALVPGWDQVVGHLDPTIHPVALFRWATHRNSDLPVDDQQVSPVAWLASGGDVQQVIELAENL